MKKINLFILLVSLLMINQKSNAQGGDAAVLAPLIAQTNALLTSTQATASAMQANLSAMQATQTQESVTNKINDDIMWMVSDMIKKSMEVKQIYEKEQAILGKLKQLNSLGSQFSSGSIHDAVNTSLNTTATLINMSNSVLSDKSTRQTDGERKELLTGILSELNSVEMTINKLYRGVTRYNNAVINNNDQKMRYKQAVESSKTASERLKNK